MTHNERLDKLTCQLEHHRWWSIMDMFNGDTFDDMTCGAITGLALDLHDEGLIEFDDFNHHDINHIRMRLTDEGLEKKQELTPVVTGKSRAERREQQIAALSQDHIHVLESVAAHEPANEDDIREDMTRRGLSVFTIDIERILEHLCELGLTLEDDDEFEWILTSPGTELIYNSKQRAKEAARVD